MIGNKVFFANMDEKYNNKIKFGDNKALEVVSKRSDGGGHQAR